MTKLVMGSIVCIGPDDEEAIPYDDAVIHIEGDEDSEIRVQCPGALRLAPIIVTAVNNHNALVKALTDLSNMYSHAWDCVDGNLVMLGPSIERFEKAHYAAQVALCAVTGDPLPIPDLDDDAAPRLLGVAQRSPMAADIEQILSEGYANGKTRSEIAEEIRREFDAPAQAPTNRQLHDAIARAVTYRTYSGIQDAVREIQKLYGSSVASTSRATGGWTPDQFWEYVGGLAGDFERDQMRDMLAKRGLALSSTQSGGGK